MPELPIFAIRVTDLSRSLAFYQDTIGFTLVEERLDHDAAVMLDTDGDPILLVGPNAGDLTALLAERHYILAPGETIGFYGGDLVARRTALLQRGVEDAHIEESRFGDRTLKVKDPDGSTLEFIVPAERSPEEHLALYARMPGELDVALTGLSESDIELSKESGSWSIRYILHHLADGELLFQWGMLAALVTPGRKQPSFYTDGNDATSEKLGYAQRPIEPSLTFFRAAHGYFAELGRSLPGAWERVVIREDNRQITFGEIVTSSIRHSAEHIEEIYEIRRVHGK
jgi:catechol 2,3-dioxygenase-like lactoylglutathione lyase family enzyme